MDDESMGNPRGVIARELGKTQGRMEEMGEREEKEKDAKISRELPRGQ